jgi:hypothetical protein
MRPRCCASSAPSAAAAVEALVSGRTPGGALEEPPSRFSASIALAASPCGVNAGRWRARSWSACRTEQGRKRRAGKSRTRASVARSSPPGGSSASTGRATVAEDKQMRRAHAGRESRARDRQLHGA